MKINDLVLEVVRDLGEEHAKEDLQSPDSKTKLFGKNLDSMGIVYLVTEIEEKVFDALGVQISLADERAMSQKTSPFRNVSTLVEYIELLVSEQGTA